MPHVLTFMKIDENDRIYYDENNPLDEKWDPNDLTDYIDELTALHFFLKKYHKDVNSKFYKFYSDLVTVGRVKDIMMRRNK